MCRNVSSAIDVVGGFKKAPYGATLKKIPPGKDLLTMAEQSGGTNVIFFA
jgi:hypothetical protein